MYIRAQKNCSEEAGNYRNIHHAVLGVIFCLTGLLAGCATTSTGLPPEEPPMHTINEFRDQRFADVHDPWEGFNRSMYKFNYYFDTYLLLPVVNSYEFVTPTMVQKGVSNLFNNLGEIRNLTNNVLQLKSEESLITLGRFVTNSTIGIGGLFDPATSLGLKRRHNDFGLTLGFYGATSGPYLVLPLFGPSNVRDTSGYAVDSGLRYGLYSLIDPFGAIDEESEVSAGITGLEVVDRRHQESFRYFQSDYPFEYYMVRFFSHEKREIEIRKGRIHAGKE
ncbi:MlaA family lipoprotein [Pelotalea chapellei]|uniref:VacJ family lipoprotein n=1 Tax=Pelotalea chapellei TaxID=44671 RepID=A0ABS5UD35_9BACT|nr:VacJ family lipoprotein [Pelotalea chapellei]MBT1073551.1 VacJ family lipoprotein [Pelotalea chapellei]